MTGNIIDALSASETTKWTVFITFWVASLILNPEKPEKWAKIWND
jgi:hypothetical protein